MTIRMKDDTLMNVNNQLVLEVITLKDSSKESFNKFKTHENDDKYLWRVEARHMYELASFSLYSDPKIITELYLHGYRIIKRTPKGAWIGETRDQFYSADAKRFILLTANKKFACNTRSEALESFLFRKRKHVSYLKLRVNEIQDAISVAEKIMERII